MEKRTYELVPKKVLPTTGISVAIIVGKAYEMYRNVLHELFTEDSVCIKVVSVYVED